MGSDTDPARVLTVSAAQFRVLVERVQGFRKFEFRGFGLVVWVWFRVSGSRVGGACRAQYTHLRLGFGFSLGYPSCPHGPEGSCVLLSWIHVRGPPKFCSGAS